MTKIIQPLNDPDNIREAANETLKEQFADYYVNQPAPDPLTWQSPAAKAAQQQAAVDPAQAAIDEATELSRQNDPLKDL